MFTDIQGAWPTHERMILVSCDETYFNRYFPRFYKTFTKHWQLPIHAHLIDPSKESLARLTKLGVSHTWCDTTDFDWAGAVTKFRTTDHPDTAFMPISPIPAFLAAANTGCNSCIFFEPAKMSLLAKSYQPAGVIAICARLYQPVSAAANNTCSAFSWVLIPK